MHTWAAGDQVNASDLNANFAAVVARAGSYTAGAAITAGQPLHLTPYGQADGGILLDTRATATFNNVTNRTISIVIGSNSNRILLVSVIANATPSSVTYNGSAMTLVTSQAPSSVGYTQYVYKLVAPSTGTNNLVVTSTGIQGVTYQSWYNVSQATNVEAFANVAASGTLSITPLSGGARVVMFLELYHSSGTVTTVAASGTSPYNKATDCAVEADVVNNTVATHGDGYTENINVPVSTTITTAYSGGGGTQEENIVMLSLAPATVQSMCVVPTSANAAGFNEPLIDFIGFADASAAVGATVSVTQRGIATGLSSLTAGKKYLLQNSAGTIGTSRGTYGKVIGRALSSTTLLIEPEKTTGAQFSRVVSYTYTAECDGFLSANVPQPGSNTLTMQDGNFVVNISGSGTTPGTLITVPVSRGKTYSFGASMSNAIFIPTA